MDNFLSPILYTGKFKGKEVVHDKYKSDVFSLGMVMLDVCCLR